MDMRKVFILPLFLLAGCSGSPTAPTTPTAPPAPTVFTGNLSGTWTGTYTVTGCSPTAAPNTCTMYVPKTPGAMTLTLTQSGKQLSGTFNSDFLSIPFAVTGTVDDAGRVTLQGTRQDRWSCLGFVGESMDDYAAVRNWKTEVTKTGDLLGTFTQSARHSLSSCYFTLYDFPTEVISLKRK